MEQELGGTDERGARVTRRGIVGAAAAASIATVVATTRDAEAQAPPPAGPAQLNLRDFGAVGDNTTDDGPALRAAFAALAAAGGGELVIPAGRFVIASQCYRDFRNAASYVRIAGVGSASQLVIKAGQGRIGIGLANVEHLVIQGVTFVGTPSVRTDAWLCVYLASCLHATIRDCSFYGLSAVDQAGASVLRADTSQLRLQNCAFRGCGGSFTDGVVSLQNWSGVHVEDCLFLDYGTLNGVFHTKTAISATIAWIRIGTPIAYPATNSLSQGAATVRNCVFDEGAFGTINVNGAGRRITHVHIEGIQANVNGTFNGVGVWLSGVDLAVVENSWFGFSANQRDAVRLSDVKRAQLQRLVCAQLANRITADNRCASVTIVDSTYTTLVSQAAETSVVSNGRGGVLPAAVAGPVSDASFETAPPNGTLAVDTANSVLYVRVGGVWKRVALS